MKSCLRKLLLYLVSTTPACASVISFFTYPVIAVDAVSWAQLGLDQTVIPQAFSAVSAGGLGISGVLTGSAGLTSVVCSAANPVNCSYGPQPGYASGDTLVLAEDTSNAGSGPITLSFSAQFGLGAYVQATAAGPFTALLSLYTGNTLDASQAYSSDVNGDPLFLGALDNTKEITQAVFSVTTCGSFACDPHDMSIDTLQIYSPASIPEPGTLWLAGMVLAAGAISTRIRKRNIRNET